MQLSSCIAISQVGFFFGGKTPKIDNFFIVRNFCLPAFSGIFHPRKKAHTFQPMLVCAFTICSILTVCCFSQIFKTVVGFIPIDVVNLVNRHVSGYIKPSQTMCGIRFTINFNINISFVFLQITRFLSNFNFWAWSRPLKFAVFWRIGENRCKVRMFHASIMPDHESDCNTA